jgi:hypothetical protein
MTREAPRGRNPSHRDNRWRTVSDRDNGHFNGTAGQSTSGAGQKGRPQQDSNLRSRLRRALIAQAMTSEICNLAGLRGAPGVQARETWGRASGSSPVLRGLTLSAGESDHSAMTGCLEFRFRKG